MSVLSTPVDEHQWLVVLLYSVLLCISVITCDNGGAEQKITGCSGFVKTPAALSQYRLKYDAIQIHLVTADGAVKDKTECAPHNGYFFVPTFEQGAYKLRVVPPTGWQFEPSEYEVAVSSDGKGNTCEDGKDFNFILSGFTVQGQILTKGTKSGPSNVEITMSSSKDKSAKSVTTKSMADGKFKLSPVLPGSYQLSVEDNKDLHLEKASVPLEVSSDNVDNAGPLLVLGFSVSGSVSSESEPVLGVKFLLFPQQKGKKSAINCDSKLTAADGFKGGPKGEPECFVSSDSEGKFRFPALTPGQYELVPFYKSGKTQFDVKPTEYKFTVGNSPIAITPNFEVSGFSVGGSVKLSPTDSKGIEGAEIVVNGKSVAKTDAGGKFLLEKMTVGQYVVAVKKSGYEFNEVKVHLVPSKPDLETLYVSKVKLCGSLHMSQFPSGHSKSLARKVEIVSSGGKAEKMVSQTVSADEKGVFCGMVPIATKSTVKPVVSKEEKSAGLMFKKEEVTSEVKDIMVKNSGIMFEQKLTSITGLVQCIDVCKSTELSIKLFPKNNANIKYEVKLTAEGNMTKFTFANVLFDVYTIKIDDSVFCWKANEMAADVWTKPDTVFSGAKFEQTGFVFNVDTAFDDVTLKYEHSADPKMKAVINNMKSQPRTCLPKSGSYKITTQSCFKFGQESYTLATDRSKAMNLKLEPELFLVDATIESPTDDFEVSVAINDVKQDEVIVEELEQGKKWKLSVYAKKGDHLSYSAESGTLLFTPKAFLYTVDGHKCPGNIVKFSGRPGDFLEATLSSKTDDVTVEVLDSDGNVFMSQVSSEKHISIGPLEDKSLYKLRLSKQGYVFTLATSASKDKGGIATFTVNKLASISISVKDEANVPLVGALMSVSDGERQYRSNNLTNSDGQLLLLNLGPGEYFIKPLKKEFTFSPANKLLKVGEGENSVVDFTAVRTAFTCFGVVKTPSMDTKAGVTVLASGVKGTKCEQAKEEGVSQADGTFTILGLQANCEYDISVRLDRQLLHYAVPLSKTIAVEKRDVTGVNFVVFPKPNNELDLNGYVETTEEKFLQSLSVSVYPEDGGSTGSVGGVGVPIETHSLDQVPFFYFTSLSQDEKWYTLRLESTLSKSEYSYNLSAYSFQAVGSSLHVRLRFDPTPNIGAEDDVTQGGLLLPLLIVLAGICTYNYHNVKGPMLNAFTSVTKSLSNTAKSVSGGDQNRGGGGGGGQKKKKSVKTN